MKKETSDSIYNKYIAGKITIKTVWARLKKLPKSWTTKEWKDKRALIIKNECEKCGCTGIMVLNHYWHPPKANQIKKAYIRRNLTFKIEDFLKWERMAIRTKAWPYILKEGVIKRFLNSFYIKDKYYKENQAEVDDYVYRECYKNHKRYMSLEDTETLCRSCAAKFDYSKWGNKDMFVL